MAVRGGEDSDMKAVRFHVSRFFFCGKLFRTARTPTAAVGRHKGMIRKVLFRRLLPGVNFYRTRCQALQVHLRLVLRVERRETAVTRRAMEKYPVAEHALGVKHACQ